MPDYILNRKELLDVLKVAVITDELKDMDYVQFIVDITLVLSKHFGGEFTVRYDHVLEELSIDIDRDEKIPEGQENIYDNFNKLD